VGLQSPAGGDRITLTMEGWNQVQPLLRPGGVPGRCFVAMWFSDETRAAYEHGIEPAVSDAGFTPIRIDRKEHNNEIPDEIIAEIRNAQFMVADFTGQRQGVYYEAGFAMGLRLAKELEIAFQDGGLDDLTEEIVQMFVGFVASDLEDVVALYAFHQPVRPREDRSEQFPQLRQDAGEGGPANPAREHGGGRTLTSETG